ncbi:MAG: efflux RND transporter periplasmic adaptor subunit, partial [Microcystaceae cyanobacterium]
EDKAIASGAISFISPNVDSNAQSILARASFSNAGTDLLNRQLVQARIIWSQAPGILIPAIAISRMGGESFVFVVKEGKPDKTGKPQLIAQKKDVKLGSMQGNNYQVLNGLNPGDRVITAGILNIQDGAAIMEAGKMPKSPPN